MAPAEGAGPVAIGVDLGGTKIAAAVVGRDGSCGEIRTVPTPGNDGPQAILRAVADLVPDVAAGREICAVGVGSAGAIDQEHGVVVSSTDTLRGWTGTPVAPRLQEMFGVPVAVLNDVDAHALGEARQGAAADAASVLVVAAGTGIGAAVVLEGQVLRGGHHMAGEVGHLPVPGAEGLLCPCGREGHLEAVASGHGLARLHARLHPLHARLHSRAASAPLTAREIVALADEGDLDAQESVRRSATALGRGIAGMVTVLDPEVVLLTGGLADAGELWWSSVEQALRADLVDHLSGIPLRPGALGGRAAIVGAAEAARGLLDRDR